MPKPQKPKKPKKDPEDSKQGNDSQANPVKALQGKKLVPKTVIMKVKGKGGKK